MVRKIIKIALPLLMLVVGIIGFRVLAGFKKPPPTKTPPEVVVPVRVIQAKPFKDKVTIQALGTVIPAREVSLQAEVTGLATEVSANLVAGGRIAQGDVLVKIDPRDYRLAIKQQAAQVEQAKLRVEEEESRRAVAAKEWALLSPEIQSTERGKALALREPQGKSVRVALTAAEGVLERARLALERTGLKSPMNAVVRRESVEVGQRLGPGSPIATLVGSDVWWIRTTIDRTHIESLKADELEVEISQSRGERSKLTWPARLERILPEVEATGQMVQAMVAVDDPLGLTNGRSPLFLGDTVEVHFKVPPGIDLSAIPRRVLRPGGVLWVVSAEDTLEVRSISPVWKDKERLLVKSFPSELRVISSRMATPTPGLKLKVEGQTQDERLRAAGASEGVAR